MVIKVSATRKEERSLIWILREKVRESGDYYNFSDFVKDAIRSKGREKGYL